MPGPVMPGQRRRHVRIADLSRPSATPEPTPQPVQRSKYTCCGSPDVTEDNDGRTVCFNCGEIYESSNVVSEITFGETSGGRAMVHGGTVGNDQRHANSMGGQVSGINGDNSRQTTVERGRSAIAVICSKIGLQHETPVEISARKWYQLALNHSFVQGRGIFRVAAAAIYLASRKQRGSTVLLMDLAEAILVNVWHLGTTYRDFCKVLMADASSGHDRMDVLDIEPLMLKFCEKLEFDQDAYRVASDACLLLKRMSRDWMVQGRNPAGICGACIIQAARMNNFRRTVREVVYVVRVADTTINQRLYEFRRTQSAALTVKQFREYAPKLKTKINPPSVYRREEREMKAAERKRMAEALENGEPEDLNQEEDTGEGAEENTPQPVPSKPTKRQAAMRKKQKSNSGEAVAAPSQVESLDQTNVESAEDMVVDVDALAGDDVDAGLDALANAEIAAVADEEAIIVPKRRGRPPKKRQPVIIPEEDIEVERELEAEVIARLKESQEIFKEFENKADHPKLLAAFEKARKLVDLYKPDRNVNSEEEIGEDEFADDPDVEFCELSQEESLAKERIWLIENEDWLRQQQEKILAKAIEDARGNPKKPKQKRRKQQIGDGSVLEGRPAASAEDAAKRMLQKRAKHFSSHINYDVFKDIMPGASSSSEGTATPAEQAATPVLEQQPEPTYQTVPIGEGDDEAEEEEYEEQYAEEEEDLEHQYLSDEDQGFDENENYDF